MNVADSIPLADGGKIENTADKLEIVEDGAASPVPSLLVFRFDVELDISSEIPVLANTAQIRGRFRHFHTQAITLSPGVAGALNLGIVLFDTSEGARLFEDRLIATPRRIEPNVWAAVSVAMPRRAIRFAKDCEITIDLVKEGEYWFESQGQAALKFPVRFVEPLPGRGFGLRADVNITRLSAAPHSFPGHLSALTQDISASNSASDLQVVFDLSDLIQYFRDARLPTGIQRVQIAIITNLILSASRTFDLKVCCFTKESDGWLDLPLFFVNQICMLALTNGDTEAPDWKRVLEELGLHLTQASPMVFKNGAYLINLGTSWWLQNYFLHVRAAKAQYGIRYVPFVHDCIPIMAPEHCVEGLTRDFISWALGAFQHANHLLVNSHATARDVKSVAKRLGHVIEEPEVVTLDADFRAAISSLSPELVGSRNSEILLRNDLTPNGFVLFVSTIESRKNHLMAFSAWLSLTKKYGAARMPKLVCVGNRGWLNDAIYAKLGASRVLQEKVTLLSKIPDQDLALLYRNCLFTLYPSSYEGWGLPVTESLCYGKTPLLANSSSLPEAGGDLAVYFDLNSEAELLAALERLIFDADYRAHKEREIAEKFRPRQWVEIANQVVGLAHRWAKTDAPVEAGKEVFAGRGLWPFPVELGRYYGLTENMSMRIWPGMATGEIYRQGGGWWWPEPWGCWTKATLARVSFLAPLPPDRPAVLYIGLRGVLGEACAANVNLVGVVKRVVALRRDDVRWLTFQISAATLNSLTRSTEGVLFELRIFADKTSNFALGTEGKDMRVASIGALGFMICSSDDIVARLNIIERAFVMRDVEGLQGMGVEYEEAAEEG